MKPCPAETMDRRSTAIESATQLPASIGSIGGAKACQDQLLGSSQLRAHLFARFACLRAVSHWFHVRVFAALAAASLAGFPASLGKCNGHRSFSLAEPGAKGGNLHAILGETHAGFVLLHSALNHRRAMLMARPAGLFTVSTGLCTAGIK